jgi:hypothetical protein
MTEAETVYQQAVAAGNPRYVSSVVAVAANWLIAGVFLFWAIMGPPLDIGSSHAFHAISRGLLGLLVIALVRARPVSAGVAWFISLAFAGFGGFNLITRGTPAPLEMWEVVVTAAYAIICPLAVWQTTVQTAEQKRVTRAPSAGEPRSTPTSLSVAAFGRVMANKIADLLEAGETIIQGQKDFCGTGLAFVDGRFVYDDMRDGRLACLNSTPPTFDKALAIFSDRAAFVAWLAGQSDHSLAGSREHRDPWSKTQRITLNQLRAVATEASHTHAAS